MRGFSNRGTEVPRCLKIWALEPWGTKRNHYWMITSQHSMYNFSTWPPSQLPPPKESCISSIIYILEFTDCIGLSVWNWVRPCIWMFWILSFIILLWLKMFSLKLGEVMHLGLLNFEFLTRLVKIDCSLLRAAQNSISLTISGWIWN